MRHPSFVVVGMATVIGCALAPLGAGATADGTSDRRAVTVEALYQMNEGPGSRVMADSSGNGLHGAIDQDDPADLDTVVTGFRVEQPAGTFATGYHWNRRAPEQPPASPERIIQVDDNAHLDPGNSTFTVEIRYRTKEKFGNIIQKGQSAARGGQWKIQNPKGVPSCLFKDSTGRRVATAAKTPLNDNLWHTLTCVRTTSSVTMYVDGVFRNKQNGSTGTIDNKVQMTVGGKINCDQLETTCDYFSGEIDYVRLTRG